METHSPHPAVPLPLQCAHNASPKVRRDETGVRWVSVEGCLRYRNHRGPHIYCSSPLYWPWKLWWRFVECPLAHWYYRRIARTYE